MDAADFFLPFDEEPDVQRQAAALLHVRFNRLDVHEDLALVVRRAARVNLSIADIGFKRRRGPQIQGIDRLHVVMSVKQNRRLARRIQPVAVHDRVAWRIDEPYVLYARARQRVSRPLRRAAYAGRMLRKRTPSRNRELLFQFLNIAIAVYVDEVDHLVHDGDLITEPPPLTVVSHPALAL